MICILLVAGHASSLEAEIAADRSGKYSHLEGVPKALYPGVGGKKILDYWWDIIKSRQLFSEVFLVTNADKYKHFERWATASEFPVENIINDGTTSREERLGAVMDLELCLRMKSIGEDVLVVAADMICQDEKFDIAQLIIIIILIFIISENNDYRNSNKNRERSKERGDLAIYYEMLASGFTNYFFEKPTGEETQSRNGSVVFYCFRQSTLELVSRYLGEYKLKEERSFGLFLQWLINEQDGEVYGMKLPTGFQLIGETTLSEYEKWLSFFSQQCSSFRGLHRITKRAYARVGLMGNPSDGFYGKTISLSIKNFWAEVWICESERLILQPHPLNDPTEFGSLADLHGITSKEGYLGGLRLLQATCKKFYNYCSVKGIALAKRNFTLKYDTNIPRQVGLAGSSAIVTATLKCLMTFFNLTEADLPKEVQPDFILDVEVGELNINAGLQDRVVQVYQGLVYMDFSRDIMDSRGHGEYRKLEVSELPQFFLVYSGDPSDSGKIHSDVRSRWEAGDENIIEGMKKLAELTDLALESIKEKDWMSLSRYMELNFNIRLEMYGENTLGEQNLHMISIGTRFGAGCKFPGSGGAILGLLKDENKFAEMEREFQKHGYVVTKVVPNLQ
ncbi:glucuronokinase 1 [Eurytemora carolleeae]|uniref:glucuronokinase 1 n=1 Tax=Eurytemora carolleeae TaxID=1294199 RepID=UPI000C76E6D3|nr:glucuronokinase 1 [Eurytemora carolleeae]|eukprot:XP_023345384.1 glucuronokinase 1-like [Eurytemora affinis]